MAKDLWKGDDGRYPITFHPHGPDYLPIIFTIPNGSILTCSSHRMPHTITTMNCLQNIPS